MGRKKKDKVKKVKDKSKVEERLKQIQSIQLPDKNPYKMDNEGKIDSFMRFGMKKKGFQGTIREKMRRKKDRANRFD